MYMLHDPPVAAACYYPMLGLATTSISNPHILSHQVQKYQRNNKRSVNTACVVHVKMLFNTV